MVSFFCRETSCSRRPSNQATAELEVPKSTPTPIIFISVKTVDSGPSDVIEIRRDIHVAVSTTGAEDTKQQITAEGYRGFDPDALIIGDVHSIAAKMQQFEKLGFTDIIISNLHTDPDRAVASIQRLGEVKILLDNFTT